jgi:nitrogen fixation/metabolism regulation signal transduction histidine kinase
MNYQIAMNNYDKIKTLLDKQSTDLNLMSNYINNFSKLNVKISSDAGKCNISNIINEAKKIARLDDNGILFVLENDNSLDNVIVNDVVILKSVYNIIKNSIESLMDVNISTRLIKITIFNKKIEFRDSGSGFTSQTLENLNKGVFSRVKTKKQNGTGIGLFLIKDLLVENKIKISFKNDQGAVVLMDFNKIPFDL